MRYNIVHLIRGEVEEIHRNLIADLVRHFDIFPIYERIPSHLTLKRGFESEQVNMRVLYERLNAFCAKHKSSNYSLSGWGQFPDKAIYIDVTESQEMSDTVRELLDSIRNVPGMNFHEYDNGGQFHASVAMTAFKPFNFMEVWKYLQTIEPPDFQMKFDNIAVLRKENDIWVPDRIFELDSLV